MQFGVSGGKLTVGINPDNNSAILHIDIPGAVDMQQLLGLDIGNAEAEINSFPGEECYAFKLELDVFGMFEAEGELELKRIYNGALIPNTLVFRAASEVGVPLVPQVVVAKLNGLGGGFKNLADTINGDFFAVPPLRLLVSAKSSVLKIIEGWCTVEIGAGFYKASLTEATLLEMDIIDEYSWYMELVGDIRNYNGSNYKGLKVGGGMKLVLSIPNSDLPFIQGGGEFNVSAFEGLNDYKNPTKAYLSLGCDGRVFGLVQIPADAWFIDRTMEIASAEIDFALGGQITVNVTGASFSTAIKDAFGSISGYGGVAYTGSFLGFPYRVYYIFQNKKVGLDIGSFLGELEPFDPNPYAMNGGALVDPATGE
ncbi:MAG: hypothetical protein GX111_11870 [Clostridiales bacterium]|nr:hypothetical protein [Clostridiales bacterium]